MNNKELAIYFERKSLKAYEDGSKRKSNPKYYEDMMQYAHLLEWAAKLLSSGNKTTIIDILQNLGADSQDTYMLLDTIEVGINNKELSETSLPPKLEIMLLRYKLANYTRPVSNDEADIEDYIDTMAKWTLRLNYLAGFGY